MKRLNYIVVFVLLILTVGCSLTNEKTEGLINRNTKDEVTINTTECLIDNKVEESGEAKKNIISEIAEIEIEKTTIDTLDVETAAMSENYDKTASEVIEINDNDDNEDVTIESEDKSFVDESSEFDVVENKEVQSRVFSINEVPEYCGKPYAEINNNVPFFTDFTTESFEIYSELDELGRCGVAYANINIDLMPTESRGAIGSVYPTGWHTVNYNGIIDDVYLYNRCHLIGFQLAGENANERNLITGTRYMNISGMQPFENRVADYVKCYNIHVLYRVTPIFVDNELVARGVLMEAYSVEDNGALIKFCVFCYNVQPRIEINYATGDSMIISDESPFTKNVYVGSDSNYNYVLNSNTKRFHLPTCTSVYDIKSKNIKYYEGNRENLINMGYIPCKACNP